MSNEEILEPIQNALYATNRFTTDECNTLADGILMYLKDAGYSISADQEKEKVAVTMEQTPIEKAIDLINANKNQAEHLTSFEVHNAFYNMLQSLLPYEKKRDRKIAENAWDACEKFIYAEQQNDNYEAIGRDERVEVINKQSYLNKKHPKH